MHLRMSGPPASKRADRSLNEVRPMTTVEVDGEYIEIEGPAYMSEEIMQSMLALLIRRGASPKSIKFRAITAHNIWAKVRDEYGVSSLYDVDVGIIKGMFDKLVSRGVSVTTAKSYLADLGTLVFANTGRNPYTGSLVQQRKMSEDQAIDRYCSGSRFESELREYARDMSRRGLKDLTVRDNISNLSRVLPRMENILGYEFGLGDIGFDELMRYRMATKVSERTCKREIEILRRFIRFVTGNEPLRAKLLWNCTDDEAPNRKYIFKDQWRRLIEDVEPDLYLILCLGAAMGLRRAEIASIRLDDIDDEWNLTIHGKGHGPEGKLASVNIPPVVREAIARYMPVREDLIMKYGDNSDGHLLIQRWKGKGTPMTPGGVGDLVKHLGKRKNIPITAHSLRRLFATTIHDAGTDDDTLRRMMRHSNIQTTMQCYLQPDPRKKEKAMRDLTHTLFDH